MSGSLTHSPADVIRRLLVSLSQGTLPSASGVWPIHVGLEPDSPDNCITVYNTQGKDLGRKQIDGKRIEHHGIQVRLRVFGEEAGYLKSRSVCLCLDETIRLNNVIIAASSYLVYSVSRTTDVIPLGKQVSANKLDLFTINATVSLVQNS